jgi:RND family efflux transporter MFP subunit
VRDPGAGRGAQGRKGGGGESVAVQVEPATKGSVEEAVVLSGSLEPQYQVDVFSRRAGRLSRLSVKEGQRVKAGDPIAAVDYADLVLQRQQAEAGLAASRATFRKAEAQREKAAGDYDRVKALFDQRAMTPQELRNAADQLKEAQIQSEVAKAQMQQSEANVALVKLQQDQVAIVATTTGVITRTFGVVGTQVTTSSPVATIAGVDPIEVAFSVAEKDLGRLRVGQVFAVSVDAFPNESFPGKITSLGTVIDASTRTLSVRGRIENPDLRLRSGMFARVELVVGRKDDVVALPREALMSGPAGFYVFVVTDGVARTRPVTLGVQGRDRVEILDGLKLGEPVAVVGQQQLRDAQQVRAVSSASLSGTSRNTGSEPRPGRRGGRRP